MAIPLPTIDLLDSISVATPCDAPWRDMRGDERSRFCSQCQRQVYDLSAMTTAEALRLLGDPSHRPCIRFFRRRDGRVMTEDCPVGIRARMWRRLKRRAALLASLLGLSFPGCAEHTQGAYTHDPLYPLEHHNPARDQNKVVVALLVAVKPGGEQLLPGVEDKLAAAMARKLSGANKDRKQKVVIVDQDLVARSKQNTSKRELNGPDRNQALARLGNELGADCVLVIHLGKISLYQPGSDDQLYEAQAEVCVDVIDVASRDLRWDYEVRFRYTPGGSLDPTAQPVDRFRQDVIEHLAAEIVRRHVNRNVHDDE